MEQDVALITLLKHVWEQISKGAKNRISSADVGCHFSSQTAGLNLWWYKS